MQQRSRGSYKFEAGLRIKALAQQTIKKTGILKEGGSIDKESHIDRGCWNMKALPKNQGRTDQILGAMADMLTSLAIPSQKWVSDFGFSPLH